MVAPTARTFLACASILALLLVAVVPSAPAGGAPALVADAGDSLYIPVEGSAPVTGAATGGVPPYAYAWSFLGSGARFADPAAAATTFDAAGIPAGDVDLTLIVTDATGATATDTVRHKVDGIRHVFTDTLSSGIPDELILTGAADGATRTHSFTVPAGTAVLSATLTWTDPANDLDLHLYDADGNLQGGNGAATGNHPETLTLLNPAAGEWEAVVEPFSSGPETYTLTVSLGPSGPILWAFHGGGSLDGELVWGRDDVQRTIGYSSAPNVATVGWDLDGDGLFDDAGTLEITTDFAPGAAYPVGIRVQTTDGYRDTHRGHVIVRDTAEHVRLFICPGGSQHAQASMEYAVQGGTCWNHIGHHTYYLGETPVSLVSGGARAFIVEQLQAPPSSTDPRSLRAPVTLEASLDGIAWFTLGAVQASILVGRQEVRLDAAANDAPFRFVRAVVPQSLTRGLSGYLDFSFIELAVNKAPDAPPLPSGPLPRSLTCERDILEDFFPEHPCTFGGIDRYDSPSAYHTYYLGTPVVPLHRIEGTVNVAPWRTDDFFLDFTDEGDVNASYVPESLEVGVDVEVSVDGVKWTRVGTVRTVFGAPTGFAIDLDVPKPARFVRFHAEKHPEYDNHGAEPALHHFRGFMLHSGVTLS